MKNILLILILTASMVFADTVDRTKPVTIDEGIVTFVAWEGTIMRMGITNAIELGVVTNGWGGYSTNAVPLIRVFPDDLVPVASAYRSALRSIFGSGAETNRVITEKAVFGYYFSKNVQGQMTDQDRDKKDLLQNAFFALSEWNGTNEVWTLFEKYGDKLP